MSDEHLGSRLAVLLRTLSPKTKEPVSTEEFHDGLTELVRLAHESVPAIMCSEAVPWRCHRRLVTDALIVAGLEVFNIMSATSTKQATLTPFAHVEGVRITYPAPEAEEAPDREL